jgi:cyclopropane fatty-acyl-phospholipid synthase-like methyltransferase
MTKFVGKKTSYDAEFFDELQDGSLASARVVVPLLLQLISPKSVVDIGCGQGAWLRAFLENGICDVLGMDGSYVRRSNLVIPEDKFREVDLTGRYEINRNFDLAVCVEVAEHLLPSAGRYLVKTITERAAAALFSAAVPGQRGTSHINEQWPEYWRAIFFEHGFVRLDPIRRRIYGDSSVDWWYRQNLFLYVRESSISTSPSLQEEVEHAGKNEMEVIHADILGRYKTLKGLLSEIPSACLRAIRHRAR